MKEPPPAAQKTAPPAKESGARSQNQRSASHNKRIKLGAAAAQKELGGAASDVYRPRAHRKRKGEKRIRLKNNHEDIANSRC